MPITLIILAAIGAVCFTIGAGIFLYHNDRRLVSAREWIEHTQEVLLSVQRASQQTDRIEAETKWSIATKDAESVQAAQRDAIRLQTSTLHLKQLVSDNRNQDANIQELLSCTSALTRTLNAPGELDAVKAETLRCRQALALMTEQENELLGERTATSSERSQMSVVTELSLAALSLAAIAVLFSLLARDALFRARIARQWLETNRQLQESNRELAQTMTALEQHAKQATLLAAFRDELQLCATLSEVYSSASVRFPQLLPGTNGAFAVINNSRDTVEKLATWGNPGSVVSEIFTPNACCGLRGGQVRWRGPGESEIDCSHFVGPPPDRYVCIPLAAQGETLGVLSIECPTEEIASEIGNRPETLRQLVHLTAIAHASLELRSKLENQSIRDSLTGLFNRHFMQIALDRELARAIRRKNGLAVFMIDVDHFKEFNDRFSHAAGDTVLREVAKTLQGAVRAEDVVCRYGGEEFTVILPEITENHAMERAENLRRSVESLHSNLGSDIYSEVTVSIGVALFPAHGNVSDSLLRQADAALYRAKNEGRNRTCISNDGFVKMA
ncbi:sensor domain-containing diguanylate cyclase [Acidicapsa dinghuensis]|uniref:diguanylate cyclase n=1 Tax=Acidicapsa dinghuensis TaxID=2218256 RepID=A0ABW1EDM0_9BACT|nr:diguanylate cyclase [Acidicapsa dinghuensis]